MPSAGEPIRASDLGDWANFTLTFDTGVTALGNAVVTSRYIQRGDTVEGFVHIIFGSTSTFSGTFIVDLPVAAAGELNQTIGTIFAQDGGALGSRRVGALVLVDATTAFFMLGDVANNVLTATAPWTWASTDTLAFSFTYEAA